MKKAPVIVFAYNRKEHLRRTLEALMANEGANETDLYIFVDAPKNGVDEKNTAVKEYLKEFEKNNNFAKLELILADKHKGLAKSVITGVSKIIDEYGKVIVVEDDIVTSAYFLNYMNDALAFYEEDKKIWSISGYTLPLKALKDYKKDVYAFYRCCSWGWATWKDRWVKNDWEVKDFKAFDHNFFRRARFNRGGKDLSFQLDRQMLGWIDSWAIRWGYNEYKNNCLTIYPRVSYVDNEGFDGSGTHFGKKSTNYDTVIEGTKDYKFEKLDTVDKNIGKQFRDRYSEKWLKSLVKEVLYCIHLYKVK